MSIEQSSFEEFMAWYKALNMGNLKNLLIEALDDRAKLWAYQLTSPEASTRQLEQLLSEKGITTTFATIANWQKQWVSDGLMKQISPNKRERIFDLEALGFDLDTKKPRS